MKEIKNAWLVAIAGIIAIMIIGYKAMDMGYNHTLPSLLIGGITFIVGLCFGLTVTFNKLKGGEEIGKKS